MPRYSAGVSPVQRRKARWKLLGSENPTRKATSEICEPVVGQIALRVAAASGVYQFLKADLGLSETTLQGAPAHSELRGNDADLWHAAAHRRCDGPLDLAREVVIVGELGENVARISVEVGDQTRLRFDDWEIRALRW